VSSSWARQHQTWAHLKRAGRGQHRPSSIHPPLQVTCASFLRQVHRRMHHLQTRSVATTAQHLTDAHHSDRLPQAAVARPSGGGGVGGHVAGCDRQTVVHDFDFYFLKPPEGVVPNVACTGSDLVRTIGRLFTIGSDADVGPRAPWPVARRPHGRPPSAAPLGGAVDRWCGNAKR
jgi:hypothetical protein